MPVICRFFGITIRMFYADHLPPHFHASYRGDEATVDIDRLALLHGCLPPRATALLVEWASLHQAELRQNWERARAGLPVVPIDPLE